MILTIIRWTYYGLFFLTPLVMSSATSELFEFNKMMLIYLATIIIGGLWSVDKLIYNRKVVLPRLLISAILIFLFSQIISTVFSIDVHTSLFGYYGRFNGGLASIISYIVLFFVCLQMFTRRDGVNLIWVTVTASSIVLLWGLPGWFGHDLSCLLFTGNFTNDCWTNQFQPAVRMFSTLGQPNWLGAYLVIHVCLGLWLLFRDSEPSNTTTQKKHKKQKEDQQSVNLGPLIISMILPLLYTGAMITGVLLTRSRSAILAMAVCLLLFGIYILAKHIKNSLGSFTWDTFKRSPDLIKLAMLTFVTITCLVGLKTGIGPVDTYLQLNITEQQTAVSESESISKETQNTAPPADVEATEITDSFDIRKIVWEGAIKLGQQYPLFGTGPETFAYAYYFTRPVEHNLTTEWDFIYNKVHNEFLNYYATTGVLGLMAYLGVILSVYYTGIRFLVSGSINGHDSSSHKRIEHTHELSLQEHNTKLLIVILLLAYTSIHITNFFGFSTTTLHLFFYLIPALIFCVQLNTDEHSDQQSQYPLRSIVAPAGILFIITVSFFLLVSLYRYYLADQAYALGKSAHAQSQYQEALSYLQTALELREEHVYEDKMSSTLANIAFLVGYDENEEASKQYQELADGYNSKSLLTSKQNVVYWKTRAKNKYVFFQIDTDTKHLEDGLSALEIARELAPTDPKILHSQALYYSQLALATTDTEKEEQYLSEGLTKAELSVELKPDYRDGLLLKAQILTDLGETEQARETYTTILETINPEDVTVQERLKNLE